LLWLNGKPASDFICICILILCVLQSFKALPWHQRSSQDGVSARWVVSTGKNMAQSSAYIARHLAVTVVVLVAILKVTAQSLPIRSASSLRVPLVVIWTVTSQSLPRRSASSPRKPQRRPKTQEQMRTRNESSLLCHASLNTSTQQHTQRWRYG